MATTLEAELREETGKGAGRRLRATGRVPGILYGHNMEPLKLSISGQDLLHLFHASGGASMVLDLKVDGATHLAIPRRSSATTSTAGISTSISSRSVATSASPWPSRSTRSARRPA